MDIIIVGGGIAGQTLALSLHAQGIGARIRIYDSAPTLLPLGVGINLLPHAVRELAGLGLLDALAAVAVEPNEFAFFTHHGQLVYREPCGRHAGYAFPHFSVHRGELLMVLYEAAQQRIGAENIMVGHRCVGVEQDADSATAHFVDGRGQPLPPQQADVVIACDGIHSAVRRQFYPNEGPPRFHGINLWRGITRRKAFLSGASVTRAGGLFTTGKMVIYPIRQDIDGEGTQLINWNAELVTDVQSAVDWHKPGKLEDFLPVFKDWRFDWLDVAELITSADFVLTYPMVDRDPVPQWTYGRVTLLGDAAHPMYPRGGNGGAQAIIDATTLARLIRASGDPVAALRAFEAERLPLTTRIVLENRTAPPDLIIDTVERLTGGKRFDRLSDVIPEGELKAISDRYKVVAGYDFASVGRTNG